MKRTLVLTLLLGAFMVAGCGPNKGAAEMAITAAQAAFDAAKEQAMRIAPEEALGIQASIDAARASMEKSEYKAAIDSANVIPARAKELADGLPARAAQLQAAWEKMISLPQALVALNDQVVKLAKSKQLPSGVDAAAVSAAKEALGAINESWSEAKAAYEAGNLAEAMTNAGAAKQATVDAMNSLRMPIPATMQ